MRDRPEPLPTLAELIADHCRYGNWLPVHCFGKGCGRNFPVALVPLLIRWGGDATIEMLNRYSRCAACCARAGEVHIRKH